MKRQSRRAIASCAASAQHSRWSQTRHRPPKKGDQVLWQRSAEPLASHRKQRANWLPDHRPEKQRLLHHRPLAHHRSISRLYRNAESHLYNADKTEFFNTTRPLVGRSTTSSVFLQANTIRAGRFSVVSGAMPSNGYMAQCRSYPLYIRMRISTLSTSYIPLSNF